MQPREESLRHRIALGWMLMCLVQTLMLVHTIAFSILENNNFKMLRFDPGLEGLQWIMLGLSVYLLMPVYVHLVHGFKSRAWRWFAVALICAGFSFMLLHHMAHWYFGQRPGVLSHVLDITIHLIGVWVIVSSVRWAKFPRSSEA